MQRTIWKVIKVTETASHTVAELVQALWYTDVFTGGLYLHRPCDYGTPGARWEAIPDTSMSLKVKRGTMHPGDDVWFTAEVEGAEDDSR